MRRVLVARGARLHVRRNVDVVFRDDVSELAHDHGAEPLGLEELDGGDQAASSVSLCPPLVPELSVPAAPKERVEESAGLRAVRARRSVYREGWQLERLERQAETPQLVESGRVILLPGGIAALCLERRGQVAESKAIEYRGGRPN